MENVRLSKSRAEPASVVLMDNGRACIKEADGGFTPGSPEGEQNFRVDGNRRNLRIFPGVTFAFAVATQRDPVRFA